METTQIEETAGALATRSTELVVGNATQYEGAAEFLLDIKSYRKQLGETFDPIINKAHSAHKEAIAQKRRHEQPAIHAEKIVKGRMLDWQRAEQARADREAREAEAEAQRLAEEEQLAAAEAAEKAGNAAQAEAIISEPAIVAPVVPRPAAPKVAGISIRTTWKFEITNAAEVPRQFMSPDRQKIGATVRAMKGSVKIPGVRIYEEQGMGAGR